MYVGEEEENDECGDRHPNASCSRVGVDSSPPLLLEPPDSLLFYLKQTCDKYLIQFVLEF